ncbi:hypothetical protein [Streptomyces litchfieldiae]|uniref:Uncharacterized protein n=1 Tax=Streptomyces litchfieldiae TaxID=3075543 RepID=A0ABU2MWM7_9ACTN|nr:hypothetical protein [Streptomyces sp. DSM 44938]MDT0346005.1 hypothetical protein [Streptomyces sp. DSM 44938]
MGDPTLGMFRRACHEAARRTPGVTFYELTEAAGAPNFHAAAMRDSAMRHRIICRSRGGFVAFTAPPPFPGSAVLHYREPPAWAEVFAWYRLRVLSPRVLTTPLSAVDLQALDAADRAAVVTWRPGTLGELLFNWWDAPGPGRNGAGRPAR